jgi:hypothetical protein
MRGSIALFITAIAFALMAVIVIQVLTSTDSSSSSKSSNNKGFQYANLLSLDAYKEAASNLFRSIIETINRGLLDISEPPGERRWEKQHEEKRSSHIDLKEIGSNNKDIVEDEELEYQGKHETTNNPSEMVHESLEKK